MWRGAGQNGRQQPPFNLQAGLGCNLRGSLETDQHAVDQTSHPEGAPYLIGFGIGFRRAYGREGVNVPGRVVMVPGRWGVTVPRRARL